MRAYNETKLLALRFIDQVGEATTTQVAQFLGFTPAASSSYLLKLHRQGLLNRRKLRVGRRLSRERGYRLSDKGFRKLAWLETGKEVLYPDIAGKEEKDEVDEMFVPS